MINIDQLQRTIQRVTAEHIDGIPGYVMGLLMQSDTAITQLTDRIATERARANLMREAADDLFSKLRNSLDDLSALKSKLYVFEREREAEIDDGK